MPKCSFKKCKHKAIYKSEDTKEYFCKIHASNYFRHGGMAFLPTVEQYKINVKEAPMNRKNL